MCLLKSFRDLYSDNENMFLLKEHEMPWVPTGRVVLRADRAIRSMFRVGRNRRILPSTPRYAFIPSNSYQARKGEKRNQVITETRSVQILVTLLKHKKT